MPAKVVMVNGDKFEVDMEVDQAASNILMGADAFARVEAQGPGTPRRVYVMRQHIAYAEAFEPHESLASFQ